jgi:hypothetical protein
LRTHGAIDDPNGYATSLLKDAIEYQGTAVAFIQLIAAMDRDGEIVREVRGKRTYRITTGPADAALAEVPRPTPARGDAGTAQPVEIDYDRLARAVVREVFLQAAQGNLVSGGAAPAPAPAPVQAPAPVARPRAERDEYALMLEMARLRLNSLLDDRGDRTEEQMALLRRLTSLNE